MKLATSRFFIVLSLLLAHLGAFAQIKTQPSCIVLNIDSENIYLNDEQMGNLVRLELSKLQRFEVVDRYDVSYLIEKNQLNVEECFGKICLLEIGKQLDVDYVLTGSVEHFGELIILNLRLINVKAGIIEKTQVVEYRYLPNELQTMVKINMLKMFEMPVDEEVFNSLTKEDSYEDAINNPYIDRLNLSGPRMGITLLTGETATILEAPRSEGGYGNYPFQSTFGYQFEIQYLNEASFQALFEVIPLISGLDQGMAVPSITLLNGLRNNRNGFEFAFGPTISFIEAADGYYDANDQWILASDWETLYPDNAPPTLTTRMDSRGNKVQLRSGFVFALGWTIRSGKLNIPINVFVVPNKSASRFGLSVGYNLKS